MLYLGWIAAAFMAGVAITALRSSRSFSLRSRCNAMNTFEGLRYDEVMEQLQLVPSQSVHRADGTVLRCWRERGYSISLLFDDKSVCLGVLEEQEN